MYVANVSSYLVTVHPKQYTLHCTTRSVCNYNSLQIWKYSPDLLSSSQNSQNYAFFSSLNCWLRMQKLLGTRQRVGGWYHLCIASDDGPDVLVWAPQDNCCRCWICTTAVRQLFLMRYQSISCAVGFWWILAFIICLAHFIYDLECSICH